MEAVLPFNSQNFSADLSIDSQPVSAKDLTRHILRIGFPANALENEYALGATLFTNTTLQGAVNSIIASEQIDALFVHPDQLTPALQPLKTLAKAQAIPLVVYSAKYDQQCRELALKNGVDDYFYGSITAAYLKRLEFITKLKNYKNKRGNKPYVKQAMDDAPKIKLWALKRTFDILVSGTALLFLSPIMLLVALLIKLESKGPVFYISKRAGSGYKIFDFYKFRSMRIGADAELAKLAHLNQYSEQTDGSVFFKLKNDPRVSRLGQVLRDTSLDELPQLINVLKGDMSLVGNRPLPLYEAEKLTKDQIAWRFLAPAGITGLWQVTKRGKENMSEEERIQLDMEYAMNNSFLYDMKIFVGTFPALIQKQRV
ncbi:sugar transferase [Chryseolinea lacunae]|uniref:Sugar transferase n=1 Tax=Chryseolinea lacunae TaxID=2801331 RepID=A0ABS1KYC5_9BACT|nr:sugar transferase [Chryseolinea lacunae]MBL0744252.1 sugar transferase [Chryseolinea lacunae]